MGQLTFHLQLHSLALGQLQAPYLSTASHLALYKRLRAEFISACSASSVVESSAVRRASQAATQLWIVETEIENAIEGQHSLFYFPPFHSIFTSPPWWVPKVASHILERALVASSSCIFRQDLCQPSSPLSCGNHKSNFSISTRGRIYKPGTSTSSSNGD